MDRRVIITSNLDAGGVAPARLDGMALVVAVDVEWSKNYRVRDGNVPFCYSLIWLPVPAGGVITADAARFWYHAAYVEHSGETQDLVTDADRALACAVSDADLIAGHQLCSDLAVLARAAAGHLPSVAALQAAWRQRRHAADGTPRVLDTRYDAGHVLGCASRRLVDVCADLALEVTQPELRGTSMTALHRRWLEHGEASAREKISVLNLRHALSTALAAVHAAGLGSWQPPLNVNEVLAAGLAGRFGWLSSPAFSVLLAGSDAA